MVKKKDKNVSKKIKPGAAVRSRDEFFENGVSKDNWKDKPDALYRKTWVIETNNLDEVALVKSTTKKGRHLVSKKDEKFKPEIYIKDNKGNFIKLNSKFVRSPKEDITSEDVEYIRKRIRHYPDTGKKIKQLKSRSQKKN